MNPAGPNWNVSLNSDTRKSVSFDAGGGSDSNEFGGWSHNGNVSISLKPLSSLTISTGPQLNRSRNVAQYVQTETDPAAAATYGHRYVFGTIDQTQLTLTTRVNFVLTRRASLQVFMQPLVVVGDYLDFKSLAAPRTFTFDAYPNAPFDPAFNFKSLRLNAIFRWEWRLGSALYVAWTQQRQDLSHPGQFEFGRDLGDVFTGPADNILMVKFTRWFGR